MQHTNNNSKHTNVMQQVTFMQINCNNQDFDPMVTQFNSIRLADDANLDALKTQIGTETVQRLLEDYSLENFRVYSINTKDGYTGTLELFITEAFANLIRGILTAFTDDECFDYIPNGIDAFFSMLKALTNSNNATIQKALQELPLKTWAELYDNLIPKYAQIDTTITNWETGLNSNFNEYAPCILL